MSTAPTFTEALLAAEARHRSMLCVGLDPEPAKFPGPWQGDAARIFDFCAAIVDATRDLVIAYKPQIAYFAAHRAEDQLERLCAHIRAVAPGVPVILDAKRGDIGATAEQYAREAFLRHEGKGVILLCRTSNPGGDDLQAQVLEGGERVFERVARLAAGPWNRNGQIGLVVGATYPAEVARVRELAPTLPLLIPGVGAQGGDAAATVQAGWRGGRRPDGAGYDTTGPIIVNSSRAVLYASAGADFAQATRQVADATRQQLNAALPGR
jgi:orotidine-5'-phosphate decarboxylase